MESQKEKIKEIKMVKKKRHKEVAAGIGLVLVGVFLAFGLTQTSILDKLDTNSEKIIEHDESVTIATGINPYRTTIGENGTIEFRNTRESSVNITFETNSIDESIVIPSNETGYFQASKYEDLPYRNYYNLNTGDTGEIVIK